MPLFEFHISRQARDHYQFDETIYASNGNVIFPNFHAARLFAQKMNQKRDLVRFPEQAVQAGQINALGLIDEIMHMMVAEYRRQKAPQVFQDALAWLEQRYGEAAVSATLYRFCELFPPVAVYRGEITVEAYLAGETDALPHRQTAFEEMILLWVTNVNPAAALFNELFDDTLLERETAYLQILSALPDFFKTQPGMGAGGEDVLTLLRAPALASPHSLSGQLDYIRSRWGSWYGSLIYRLLSSLDLIREEEKGLMGGAWLGPGPAQVLEFGGQEMTEPERFSPDLDWMPRLVLLAKNAFVWLDQLSKKYELPITSLADIPDAELDALARSGLTGLWLIGLWERSSASKHIKIMRGKPDAVASAYSLYDYIIAYDLGGEAAFQNLRERCAARGIRLASDMVPNHMGIDSRWVIEHPDWFVALDQPPFPTYTFNGSDFSSNPGVSIQIEDHYFTNTDAAVVFKRYDHGTGQAHYIYHGNDGTAMPWNDTAQLNYLNPEVREAVIQTILSVARSFPVIRFDAAMTLAKKHYQRLWFPEPGTGGAIPSRAEYGMTKEQFDAAMPVEFWREVVDRVAQEVPDTLLLAEAFWMMEGYFVRTLGMHRVYNSAFMNMLRDEKNAEYRLVIKNTLEFDPEILKRYVNFMNNPDERTAVDQFGKGDKYFGVCTLMATMPGLPMFGHGQLEGFSERYGMEYRRAYWDEQPDRWLMERHEGEIFPLLRQRSLFAEVQDFLLYDVYTAEGQVNEDVFAYSNRRGDERALVVYHNKYADMRGWIRVSASYAEKTETSDKRLVQKSLSAGLEIVDDENQFTIYRDHFSNLEYIRNNRELCDKGMYIELGAYHCRVFLDFRQVEDNAYHHYRQLSAYLQGGGVPSIDEALKELFLQPVHYHFRELVNPGFFRWIVENSLPQAADRTLPAAQLPAEPPAFRLVINEVESKALALLREIKRQAGGTGDERQVARAISLAVEAAMKLPALSASPAARSAAALTEAGRDPGRTGLALSLLPPEPSAPASPEAASAPEDGAVRSEPDDHFPPGWGLLLGYIFTRELGQCVSADPVEAAESSRTWLDEWLLGKLVAATLQALGESEAQAWRNVALIKILIRHGDWYRVFQHYNVPLFRRLLEGWLADRVVQRFIGVNRWQDILWFNQESFEALLNWLYTVTALDLARRSPQDFDKPSGSNLAAAARILQHMQQAEAASGFQLEKLIAAAGGSAAADGDSLPETEAERSAAG